MVIAIQWGEPRDAAEHPTVHRTDSHCIELSGPKCHCVIGEESWFRGIG